MLKQHWWVHKQKCKDGRINCVNIHKHSCHKWWQNIFHMLNGLRFLNIVWYNKELAIWYFPYLDGCFEFIFSKFSECFRALCCMMHFTVISDLWYCKYLLCKKYYGGKGSLSFVCSVYSFRELPEVKLQKQSGDFRGNVAGSQQAARLCCCGPAGRAGPVLLSLPCCSSLSPERPLGREGWWSARIAETWEHPARTWSRSWGEGSTRFLSAGWEGRAGRQDAEEGERWVNSTLLFLSRHTPEHAVSTLWALTCECFELRALLERGRSVTSFLFLFGSSQPFSDRSTAERWLPPHARCLLPVLQKSLRCDTKRGQFCLIVYSHLLNKKMRQRVNGQGDGSVHGDAGFVLSGERNAAFTNLPHYCFQVGLAFQLGGVFCTSPKRNVLKERSWREKEGKKKKNLWMPTEGLGAVRTYYEAWVEGQGFMFRL